MAFISNEKQTPIENSTPYENEKDQTGGSDHSVSVGKDELINDMVVDQALVKKMALVNRAIDEIGMTPFQWKLFFLNGFGYAVDSVRFLPVHDTK